MLLSGSNHGLNRSAFPYTKFVLLAPLRYFSQYQSIPS